jgi:hypothetical protein
MKLRRTLEKGKDPFVIATLPVVDQIAQEKVQTKAQEAAYRAEEIRLKRETAEGLKLCKKILESMRTALNKNGFSTKKIQEIWLTNASWKKGWLSGYEITVKHPDLGEMRFIARFMQHFDEQENMVPGFELVLDLPHPRLIFQTFKQTDLDYDNFDSWMDVAVEFLRTSLEEIYKKTR